MSRPTREFAKERSYLAGFNKRRCIKCHEIKCLSTEFAGDSTGADGRAGECHECRRARHRKRHYDHDGLTGALHNGYNRAARAGRRRRKITASSQRDYWEQHGIDETTCFYTGVKLTLEPGHWNSRNLDHIQPLNKPGSAGHVRSNIVPCSAAFNTHKGTDRAVIAHLLAPEELRAVNTYTDGKVDRLGTPVAPAIVEYSEGSSGLLSIEVKPLH